MRQMVASHVDSFNAFLSVGIKNGIKYIDPVTVNDWNTGESLTGIIY